MIREADLTFQAEWLMSPAADQLLDGTNHLAEFRFVK